MWLLRGDAGCTVQWWPGGGTCDEGSMFHASYDGWGGGGRADHVVSKVVGGVVHLRCG